MNNDRRQSVEPSLYTPVHGVKRESATMVRAEAMKDWDKPKPVPETERKWRPEDAF